MAYKKTDLIYVKSAKLGPIPPLRMNGPIFVPMKITVERAERCLATKIPLSQIDPITGIAVPLTMENLYDDTKLEAANENAKREREGQGILKAVSPVASYNEIHSTIPDQTSDAESVGSAFNLKDELVEIQEDRETDRKNAYRSNNKKKK